MKDLVAFQGSLGVVPLLEMSAFDEIGSLDGFLAHLRDRQSSFGPPRTRVYQKNKQVFDRDPEPVIALVKHLGIVLW